MSVRIVRRATAGLRGVCVRKSSGSVPLGRLSACAFLLNGDTAVLSRLGLLGGDLGFAGQTCAVDGGQGEFK